MKRALLLLLVAAPALADVDPSTIKPEDGVAKMEATYAAAKGLTATIAVTIDHSAEGPSAMNEFSTMTLVEDHGKYAATSTDAKGKATTTTSGDVLPRLLSGTKGGIAKEFTIAKSKPDDEVPGTVTVELTPKKATGAYSSVLVVIDPTNFSAERIVLVNKKVSTIYSLDKVDLTTKIDAKQLAAKK